MAKRRGNGEGSITKRPNGTYQGRIRYVDPDSHKGENRAANGSFSQAAGVVREVYYLGSWVYRAVGYADAISGGTVVREVEEGAGDAS